MCGRFVMLTREEVESAVRAVEQRGRLTPLAMQANRPQARPKSLIAAFREDLEIADFTWGFEFPWRKGPVFNTRIESIVSGTAAWREPFQTGRCIVPAAAFFEPHAIETTPSPRTGKPMKRPYEFASPDGLPLLLAGVSADGFCSIVTTQPNEWVSPIHDRMPLVLDPAEAAQWLEGDFAQLADRAASKLLVAPEALAVPSRTEEPPSQLSLF